MKRLLVLSVLIFTVLFVYTVVAQEMGSLRKGYEISFPEKIQRPLGPPLAAGTYTIGTGGYFPTIDSAFKKLSLDGIAGEIVLELIDELYIAPTTQYGFLLNGPIPGSSSRVTIKPAANKNVVIQGNGQINVTFNNTNYVTIDGVSLTGATTLTIHTLANTAYPYNDGIDFMNNSDHNVIQNIILVNEANTSVASGSGFWTATGYTTAPDSNLIQNNFVKQAGIAFYISAYNAPVRALGNIIRGNKIGSETDSLIAWGIQLERCQNTIVENNIIQNLKSTVNSSDIVQPGINSYNGFGDIIRNNIVHNLRANAGYSSVGILLSGWAGMIGSNNQVYNNMIYDINSTSTSYDSRVTGIQMWYQNDPKVYYNSVYLSGTGSNKYGSAALYVYLGTANADIRNNIFVNTRDESPYCASSIRTVSGYSTFMTDYNNLYYEANQYNCLVRVGSSDYHTLVDWQAVGKDFHSTSVMPCFSSPDLHIDFTMATCLEKRGTPIAGFDTDFDGDLRLAYLPDIGADEFAGMIPTGALTFGTYSVGTTGFFPSIESVFNRLSADGVAGPVILELTDNLYTAPTTQYGFSLNGPIPGAGPNSRVTIKPAANKNVVIQGNRQSSVTFNNTNYVTIDGISLAGATTLTIHTLKNTGYIYNDGIDFINNSDHNVIQNIIFINEDYTRASGSGFVELNSLGVPDSNLIQNNFVKQSGIGLYVSSYSAPMRGYGNIIRGNQIGSETDSLISWGILLERTENTIVENNIIQNLRLITTYDASNVGINSYWGKGDIIRNNVVHNIKSSSGYSSNGILLSGGDGINGYDNQVYNNMIYDIQSTSTQFDSRVTGIQMLYQSNPKIYYNSVYLSGTGSNKYGSAALYISLGCTNVEVKNNILVNTRNESPYCASSIYMPGSHSLLAASDYNDLFYEPSGYNCLVKWIGGDYYTLAEWQATGKDLHSVTEMPNFIESDTLHINSLIATNIESHGTPITGITTDFDGDTRNTTTPDIGADEFNGVVVGVEDEIPLPTEFAIMQNYPNPFNPSTKISWQSPVSTWQTLKVYDVLGNEVVTLVNEEKPAGSYEINWNASTISSGVYFYELKAGSFIQTRKMILLK